MSDCPTDGRGAKAAPFPPFRPRAPWWSGDLQTLRNYVVGRAANLSGFAEYRRHFSLSDRSGDRLQAVVNSPARPAGRPLLILLHGLTGCEDSHYLRASARYFLMRGHRVLRLNLRGAGPSRATCRFHYHAGRSEDLADVVAGLPDDLSGDGVVVMAFSLGANLMLKFLGERSAACEKVRGAVAVSAPIDLAAASRRFSRPRNLAYRRWFLARMKAEALAPGASVSARERAAIAGARTVYEFDDRFVGPRHGFAGADDYYRRCSAKPLLANVAVPTLVICARDDPLIPYGPYRRHDWVGTPWLKPLLPRAGGHVGFHGRSSIVPWHDLCAARWFERLSAPRAVKFGGSGPVHGRPN